VLPLRQPAQFSIRATQQTNYISDITVASCLDAWENETAEGRASQFVNLSKLLGAGIAQSV
jgi:hypothetical protein